MGGDDRDPVAAVLCGIFKQCDCNYKAKKFGVCVCACVCDLFANMAPVLCDCFFLSELDAKQSDVMHQSRVRLVKKYKTPEEYLHRVRILLWLPGNESFVGDSIGWIKASWRMLALGLSIIGSVLAKSDDSKAKECSDKVEATVASVSVDDSADEFERLRFFMWSLYVVLTVVLADRSKRRYANVRTFWRSNKPNSTLARTCPLHRFL